MEREEHRGRGQYFVGDRLDELIQMYQGGMTAMACAEYFGVADTTVERTLRRHDIPVRSIAEQWQRRTVIDDTQLRKMVDDGWTIATMARAFGVDDPAIRTRLTARGWLEHVAIPRGESRRSGKLSDAQMFELVELAAGHAQFRQSQLARSWHVQPGLISYHMKRIRAHGWSCSLVWGYCAICGEWRCARNSRDLIHTGCKRYRHYQGPSAAQSIANLRATAADRNRAMGLT